MEREKLKILLGKLKGLIEEIESEVYSDVEAYSHRENFDNPTENFITDYDEIFDDDDGYPD